MPLQLYDLPFDMLEMIGEFYDDQEQRDAASTLQTALKRHVVTRCEDPRHTARTNTPGEGPVLCYQSCHHHPPRSCFDYTLTNSSPAFDLLEMIGEFYDDLEQRDTSTIQTP